jgi:hypothetical protein
VGPVSDAPAPFARKIKNRKPCRPSSAVPLTAPIRETAAKATANLRATLACRPAAGFDVGRASGLAGLVPGRVGLVAGPAGLVAGRAGLSGLVPGLSGLVAGSSGRVSGDDLWALKFGVPSDV